MIDTGAGVVDADYRGIVFVLLSSLAWLHVGGVVEHGSIRLPPWRR